MAEMKISETIEFLTQVHTSWDDTEQRMSVRTRPRRSISYDYIGTSNWQSQYLRSLAYAQQTQMFQIPLWHAADSLEHMLYKSQGNVQMKPENMWQWRGCSGLILWQDDEYGGTYYPIRELTGNGAVGLMKQLSTDINAGSIVVPVAWGVLSQADSYVNVTGDVTSLNINVELMKEAEAPQFPSALDQNHDEPFEVRFGANLGTTYMGQELFLKPPTWASDMNANFSRNANRLDNKSGAFIYDLKSKNPAETRQIEYLLESRIEINNMQRFFYRCLGKTRSFYAPTWVHDFEPIYDVMPGDDFMITKYSNYWKYYANISRRKTAIVFYKDGTASIFKIAGYSTDDTGEYGKVLFEGSVTRAIRARDVHMISYLGQYRHDNDTMLTDYETVTSGTTTFTLKEVTQ